MSPPTQIKANIRNCSYEEAVANCTLASAEIKAIAKLGEGKTAMMNEKNAGRIVSWYEMIEVESLKSYCFVNMNRIQEAIEILERCLEFRPNHSLSHRRLGYAYEKVASFIFSKEMWKKP
jgi:tetratricopeptide (TPR) repeat protein